jgi:hypothetical protein
MFFLPNVSIFQSGLCVAAYIHSIILQYKQIKLPITHTKTPNLISILAFFYLSWFTNAAYVLYNAVEDVAV